MTAIDRKDPGRKKYVLKLFVSHKMPDSMLAAQELKEVFGRDFGDPVSLDIVDITQDPDTALEYNVVAVPMLTLISPAPKVTIIGSMRDREKLFAALRLRMDEKTGG